MMEYGDCLHLHMQYIDRKTQGFTLSFKSGNEIGLIYSNCVSFYAVLIIFIGKKFPKI